MLFVLANLARKLKLDPEACLRHASDKFARRFVDGTDAGTPRPGSGGDAGGDGRHGRREA